MTRTSPEDIKQHERDTWAAAADGWKRRDALLRHGAAPVTQRMLELAGIATGHQVLDIASGTGEPSISAAQQVGTTGRVVGTDLCDEMLACAREKAAAAQLGNIEYHCVDGECLPFSGECFDAVTIRWGLMFMPEPSACLQQAHAVMKNGGRLTAACWSAPEKNPFVGLLIGTLRNYMDVPAPAPGTPGIFALADPARLEAVVATAGFADIMLEELVIDVLEVADGSAYWEAISDLAAPVMALVRQLDAEARARYVEDVIRRADELKTGETLRMRGTTWIVSATK